MYGIVYFQTLLGITAFAAICLHQLRNYEYRDAIKIAASVEGVWLLGVYSSMFLWRAFVNPLNKFKGPFMARMLDLWWSFKIGPESHAFLKNGELHKKYGKFVRIGPNTISIAHKDGPNLLYGPGSKCRKAAWYDNYAPLTSMHTSRDRQLHDTRRRLWSPAFSDKALRGYEQRIKPYADSLIDRIQGYKGKPINVSQLVSALMYLTSEPADHRLVQLLRIRCDGRSCVWKGFRHALKWRRALRGPAVERRHATHGYVPSVLIATLKKDSTNSEQLLHGSSAS